MSIAVQCPECSTKYNVGDAMAGKRVKCRHCGHVLSIPGISGSPGATAGSSPTAASRKASGESEFGNRSGSFSGVGSPPAPAAARPAPARPAPARPPAKPVIPAAPPDEFDPSGVRIEREDEDGNVELAAPLLPDLRDPSQPFDFPNAALLDRIVPWALTVIGLLWLVTESGSRDEGHPNYGWFRAGMFLVLYGLIVWPLGMLGMQMANHALGRRPPPAAPWRAFAAFCLPYTLACVFGQMSQGIGGLIIGLFFGLIIVCAAIGFLFRVRPAHATVALGYAAGFFVGGILVCVLLMVALNSITLAVLKHKGTAGSFDHSPLASALSWDAPPPVEENPAPLPAIITHPSPETMARVTTEPAVPSAMPTTAQGFTSSSGGGVDGQPRPTTTPAINSIFGEASNLISRAWNPGESGTHPPPPDAAANNHKPTQIPSASPVVKQVVLATDIGRIAGWIDPTVPGNWVGIIRKHTQPGDKIELWHLDPTESHGTAVLFNGGTGSPDQYIVGPAGELLTHIADWPKLSAQVWSFNQDKVLRTIELNSNLGTPTLMGFCSDKLFVVHWDRGTDCGAEIFDARLGTRIRAVNLPSPAAASGPYVFTPDGKYLAFAGKFDIDAQGHQEAQMQLVDVAGQNRPIRKFPIPMLDPQWPVAPTGIAFSPDGTRIAMLFEHTGNALLVGWRMGENKPIYQHLFPGANFHPGDSGSFAGQSLLWLPDGNAWLLYGRTVVDNQNGRVIADLGIPQVRRQRFLDAQTLVLECVAPDAGSDPDSQGSPDQMLWVTLDNDALGKVESPPPPPPVVIHGKPLSRPVIPSP